MSTLTDEQKAKIAENKKKALERLAQRKSDRSIPSSISPSPKKQKLNGGPSSNMFNFQAAPNQPYGIQNRSMSTPFNQIAKPDQSKSAPVKPMSTPFSLPVRSSIPGATTFNPLQNHKPKVIVDLEVYSPTEIEIRMKPYLNDVKDTIRTFKSAKFHPNGKRWTIGFTEHQALTESLKTMKTADCKITGLPKWINYVFIQKGKLTQPSLQKDVDSVVLNEKIERSLVEKLFPYQRIGVVFGLERNGCLLIADEMGLGKSLQALSIARAYSSEWPLLIVCPASVKYSWKQQFHQFLPAVKKIAIIEKGTDKLPTECSPNTVIIMSYDQMVIKEKDLISAKINVIIFDESHLLKDNKTKRTKVATEISKKAKRRILLSGTPALSRPAELFSQIRLVDPKIFTNWKEFAGRYCDARQGKFGFEAKGATFLNELATILKHTVMIRRLKKDVLDDLPPKTREILYLSGDKIQTQIGELKKSCEAYDEAMKEHKEGGYGPSFMSYFGETGVCKSYAIADYIIEQYFYKDAPPVKILLFAHHTSVLDVFCMRFTVEKINHIRIDGHTKGTVREANCKKFQENPNCQVAVLSITAAGTGITLTAANKVIFAELYWNPGIFFQAEDRAHRVGQKSSVFVQYILARGTADDIIWPKIQEKILVVGNLSLNSEKLDELDEHERFVTDSQKITDYFTILEQR